ncbi:hypothetical protein BDZ90DRAFT_279390 [Jaminaea rosea]|uniref:Zn(2)-C6 fungal-type domain-containing protein n=1 Tax=Jaminaea rosea TaxID=1569628 RepID=A0A316UQK5_9BASI|nr:hypothetical protein BDZ90DRAFT_279390 [Jaminaea rosea]PWN27599.1 hypothetical protein BDZ90DRAFT_279390 [Jaminaea rosea]
MMQQQAGRSSGPFTGHGHQYQHQHQHQQQPRYGETSISGAGAYQGSSAKSSPDHSRGGDDSLDEPGKKRQRIQQACKSCGLKRVKCDGQLPCITCVRTGEHCEYGQPKKRGPPKGSTRGPNKNANSRQRPEDGTTGHDIAAPPPPSMSSNNPNSPRSRTTTGGSSMQHAGPPPPPLPFGFPSNQPQPHSYPPFAAQPPQPPQQDLRSNMNAAGPFPVHNPNAYPPSYPPLQQYGNGYPPPSPRQLLPPAPPPPPLLPMPPVPPQQQQGASSPFPPPPSAARHMPSGSLPPVDLQRGSFMAIPDVSGGPTRPRFRGGTSGILDFGRQRSHNILDSPSGLDSGGPYSGSTSPSSFALSVRPGMAGSGAGGGEQPPRGIISRTASHARALSRRPSEAIAQSLLDKNSESTRLLRYPEVPDAVEATIWSIWWQIISCHWPLLLRESLPLFNGQPRVDKERHPLLYNAAMALASKIWDAERDGPLPSIPDDAGGLLTVEKLTDLYALRTRHWLLRADNESTVEAAQAMVLMSLRENGDGRSSSSAQYAMSACRVALDIGLHRDLRSRGLPADEWQARLRLWWCIYILDKTNSAMLGRPCVLRFAESDAPFFDVDGPEEFVPWISASNSPAAQCLSGQPGRCLSHLLAGSTLATVCEEIFAQYNVVRPGYERGAGLLSGQGQQQAASWEVTLAALHARLEEWQRSLPSHLRVVGDRPVFQHVLVQQMWFHAIRVLAYRPHMLKQPSPKSGLPNPHGACTESASEIARLISLYKSQHGFKKLSTTIIYCVFTAATILLGNTTSKEVEQAQAAKMRLKELIDHLGVMSGTWTSARLQLTILRHLGECLEADLQGTGLERVSEGQQHQQQQQQHQAMSQEQAGSGGMPGGIMSAMDFSSGVGGSGSSNNNIDGFAASTTNNPNIPNYLPSVDQNAVGGGPLNSGPGPFINGGAGPTDLSSVSLLADIANDVSAARSVLPEQQLFEINDANYWSQMPLSSENGEAWAMFTQRYLDSLNSATTAAASAGAVVGGGRGVQQQGQPQR